MFSPYFSFHFQATVHTSRKEGVSMRISDVRVLGIHWVPGIFGILFLALAGLAVYNCYPAEAGIGTLIAVILFVGGRAE